MSKVNLVAEPGKQETQMSREFNAPPNLVFKAHTDPDLIARWWGQKSSITTVDKLEARAGGLWRFVDRAADGSEYAFHGVFHEVTSPERIVWTFEFEGMPGHVILETMTFEALADNKTRLVTSSIYQSLEDRDTMIAYGMEEGAGESWDSLAELVQSMQTA
jgi:uncharacterized protein YndB with AHSA1/START domain